ncbi:RNA-guided endonuclease IscB [Thermoanaerobacterium thermosaccharolyticum]|uniref:RNA-guided endonuclease IscB n=1 Tax=Thermoanaerobacterium thermosaccharolyticum TaxID=1517 RepID=UPI0020A314D4|nr:5-methylcytosine-specific restriction endonuclease McrA [Thermoanaerobacterium thermosaccharolyticum]
MWQTQKAEITLARRDYLLIALLVLYRTPKGEFYMVFVLDKHKKPLMPCTEKRARLLLESGRAVIHKINPFVIRLKDVTVDNCIIQPCRIKIDPGSKVTGIAILQGEKVLLLVELYHKQGIKKSLDDRRNHRRFRRNKLRYREPRFDNRKREKGWLPLSLEARVQQVINTVKKLAKYIPIDNISIEHVKFDTQLMQNPEISGVEYQQGELQGYEVREYLLVKWGRKCAYCGKENVPLEVEHIVPKSRGGTDRVSNLTIACHECNQKKGNMTAEEFGYPDIQKQAKQPLKDAAMINATRWKTYNLLKEMYPVECGTGALTKKNRIDRNLPKEHYCDACCVGQSTPKEFVFKADYILEFHAKGRGTRQRTLLNKYGFPRAYLSRQKEYFGFQNGDYVKAEVPKGKYKGQYTGYVAVRKSGYFDIRDANGKNIAQGISYQYCHIIQRYDGYKYGRRKRHILLHPSDAMDGVSCA